MPFVEIQFLNDLAPGYAEALQEIIEFMLGALTDFFLALEDVQRVVDSGAKFTFKRVHKRKKKKNIMYMKAVTASY